MSDLPSLARWLHSGRKLTPAQVRNRTGFLDSNDRPFKALETIQGWLADTLQHLLCRAKRNPAPHLFPTSPRRC